MADARDDNWVSLVRTFGLGRAAAQMGTQVVSVAVGWELYERTHDAWSLGLVGLVQAAPGLALVLPAGEASDRFSRRTVAMLAHAVLALMALGLAAVSWLGAPVELIYGLLVLAGIGRAFSSPAITALLPQLMQPTHFARANAWLVIASQLGTIAGPAVGGVLIAVSGAAGPAYLLAVVAQLGFLGALASLPAVPPAHEGGKRAGGLLAGAGFIRRSPIYLGAITLDLFAVLFGGSVALLPIFARDILAVGPSGLGLLRAAPPLGAMVTALVVTRMAPWHRPGQIMLGAVALYGLANVGFGLSRDMILSLACLFVAGGCNTLSVVVRKTLQQIITPNRLRGRVSAISQLFTGLSDELGAFESGATAALFGPVLSVAGGGIGAVVVVASIALACPALVRIGPLHTLRPIEKPRPARDLATVDSLAVSD